MAFNNLTVLYIWVHQLDNNAFDITDAQCNHEDLSECKVTKKWSILWATLVVQQQSIISKCIHGMTIKCWLAADRLCQASCKISSHSSTLKSLQRSVMCCYIFCYRITFIFNKFSHLIWLTSSLYLSDAEHIKKLYTSLMHTQLY